MTLFHHDSLEEVIHSRSRLAVLAYLATTGSADFAAVRDEINVSDGNLSQHLKKLEDAGYVALSKSDLTGRARTAVKLTPTGRNAFYDYLDHLQSLLKAIPGREEAPET